MPYNDPYIFESIFGRDKLATLNLLANKTLLKGPTSTNSTKFQQIIIPQIKYIIPYRSASGPKETINYDNSTSAFLEVVSGKIFHRAIFFEFFKVAQRR
jgi:hypothetical protein